LGIGISKLDRKKEKFAHLKNDPSNANSLSDNVVWSIYEAPASCRNALWIGTYRGGLNKFDRKLSQFTHYRHDPAHPHSLSQNHIRSICAGEPGALWIGTFNEGLDHFDIATGKFTHYRHDPSDPHSLSDNRIRSLCRDKSGTLWIATFGGGLNKREKGKRGFVHYRHNSTDPNSLSDDRIYTLYEDRSGTLWIGTFGGGLNQLVQNDSSSVRFIRYQHNPADSDSLSDHPVISICEDKVGTLWIGTYGGGLFKFDRQRETFTHFAEHEGLPSDAIYGILEDDRGNLWLSSGNGLSKFNLRTKVVKHYDERDGIQSKEFSGGAYYQCQNGEMFFGGINGLNSFFPDSIKDNRHVPPIVVTAFKKFNEVVAGDIDEIELSYKDNFFSFEFAALDYANPAKNQYAYMLEGFDKDWGYCGTRRFASYTNLNPGNYIFRVKGSNNDGVWNENGVVVNVTIHPPFWKTWWFYSLSAGFLVFSAAIFHNHRVKSKIKQWLEIERVRREENERLRKQVAIDFHDELGQKLTNISLYAEILKRNINATMPPNVTYLNKIIDTSRSLSVGIRDFIWTLDYGKDSLFDVIIRLRDFGDELFTKTGIDFHLRDLNEEWENVTLSMDWKRHLILIFKEGMHNSLKHAQCQHVTLEVSLHDNNLEMRLVDDGRGFDTGDDTSGLGLRNMKKRAEKIRGELQIIAQKGSGTTIRFNGRIS
jgi:signal transduction histidine kinase/streptogramin lyase